MVIVAIPIPTGSKAQAPGATEGWHPTAGLIARGVPLVGDLTRLGHRASRSSETAH
jgi:hypothetical protein